MNSSHDRARPALRREMGLLALTATGICSMIGAAINVIPFMIQKNVPGIVPSCSGKLVTWKACPGVAPEANS